MRPVGVLLLDADWWTDNMKLILAFVSCTSNTPKKYPFLRGPN